MNTIPSPYGGNAFLIDRFHVTEINRKYRQKCGMDITECFHGVEFAEYYACERTGYRFWHPFTLAGDDRFYKSISKLWPNYYRTTRWEYPLAASLVKPEHHCLEIGCGLGYFLKSIETSCRRVEGLEYNPQAPVEKVCASSILVEDVVEKAARGDCPEGGYDLIFAFQVLEHIPNPEKFIRSCVTLLKRGGRLVYSVPNNDAVDFVLMKDVFNMPPHHIGAYTPEVFVKLAPLFGLKVNLLRSQVAAFPEIDVSGKTAGTPLWRNFAGAISSLGSMVFAQTGEPGLTMVAVMEKL